MLEDSGSMSRIRVDLQDRVALVAGGTAGLGRAAALALAASGANVALVARGAERGLAVVSEIEKTGRRAVFQPADLANYTEVRAAVDGTVEQFGRLDIVVASGGGGLPAPALPFHEIAPELYANYSTVHLHTRLHVVHAAVQHMLPARSGSIVLVTTDAGRVPTPGESLIGGAAAGVIFMTRALAREFARQQVRINAVSTTLTRDTPGYEWYSARRDSDAVLVKAFRKLEQQAPFGLNHPEDVADAILYLASDAASHITGVTLSVSGGISFPG